MGGCVSWSIDNVLCVPAYNHISRSSFHPHPHAHSPPHTQTPPPPKKTSQHSVVNVEEGAHPRPPTTHSQSPHTIFTHSPTPLPNSPKNTSQHSVVNVEENAYAHLRGSLLRGNIATGNGAAVRIAKARLVFGWWCVPDVIITVHTSISPKNRATPLSPYLPTTPPPPSYTTKK